LLLRAESFGLAKEILLGTWKDRRGCGSRSERRCRAGWAIYMGDGGVRVKVTVLCCLVWFLTVEVGDGRRGDV
jgi:hypothetical protein